MIALCWINIKYQKSTIIIGFEIKAKISITTCFILHYTIKLDYIIPSSFQYCCMKSIHLLADWELQNIKSKHGIFQALKRLIIKSKFSTQAMDFQKEISIEQSLTEWIDGT